MKSKNVLSVVVFTLCVANLVVAPLRLRLALRGDEE